MPGVGMLAEPLSHQLVIWLVGCFLVGVLTGWIATAFQRLPGAWLTLGAGALGSLVGGLVFGSVGACYSQWSWGAVIGCTVGGIIGCGAATEFIGRTFTGTILFAASFASFGLCMIPGAVVLIPGIWGAIVGAVLGYLGWFWIFGGFIVWFTALSCGPNCAIAFGVGWFVAVVRFGRRDDLELDSEVL